MKTLLLIGALTGAWYLEATPDSKQQLQQGFVIDEVLSPQVVPVSDQKPAAPVSPVTPVTPAQEDLRAVIAELRALRSEVEKLKQQPVSAPIIARDEKLEETLALMQRDLQDLKDYKAVSMKAAERRDDAPTYKAPAWTDDVEAGSSDYETCANGNCGPMRRGVFRGRWRR